MVVTEGVQRVRPGIEVSPGPASRRRRPTRDGRESRSMISGVFIDRPRLAIVIAILLTLAGALSLLRIAVSQFPDIVPPQVTVATTFTGASAAVVEATVAQPIEAAVVGVDKMIYMKSNSANDGSYSLTVSFELGTNPDIDTVNVNNRVQQAIARLPPEVQHYGLTVRKRSSAILEFLQFYSEGGKQDPLFISNYVTINVLDRLTRMPWRRRCDAVRPARLLDAHLVRHGPAGGAEPGARRHHRGDPVAERAGGGRAYRRPADQRRDAIPVERADPGPPDDARAVRRHRYPRQSGRIGAAHPRRGANRAGRGEQRHPQPVERQSGGLDRHLSRAGRERGADLGPSKQGTGRPVGTLSRKHQGAGLLRQQFLRLRHHQRGGEDASRSPSCWSLRWCSSSWAACARRSSRWSPSRSA